ncbi:dTDP-4-dehydrorhamnose reductase [Methanolacinia paynteri]|uniref:dTDP-4-dehydrorhamnose reductase n=1 Tax=Methanolacinia paynteri TaxID=230356 RepID=UPI00064F76D4|nr:dTDP-4-dehydrorhamnose reductase [Methanolacinia paynteri]
MKISILILGANGMLGHSLQKVFPGAVCKGHELDITDEKEILSYISELNPDIVINSAAYTDVDGCEDNREVAFAVNGDGPGNIAAACEENGAMLVHFSTDYVFDGSKKEYNESDEPNPVSIYGKSKLLGEENIIKNMNDFRIIRTSWLYGTHGKNFVETMIRLSSEMPEVRVVNDQFGKPTYTRDLAEKTAEIIDLQPGIYHAANEGVCSWFDFARAIIPNVVPCTTDEFPRKAKRPEYSVLVNNKTKPMRNWNEALLDYLEERLK